MIETLFENRITSETPLKKMEFLFELYKVPCFPRGELVAVAGKAKSGKTSFLSMLMGTGVKPSNEPPEGKGALPLRRAGEAPLSILWYDTEQSQQSTQEILTERITKMAGDGHVDDHVFAFNVRTFGWDERLRLFQEAIPYVEPDLVVLDGVRDLIADINDGREAQLITEQLMTLAQQHWCCL